MELKEVKVIIHLFLGEFSGEIDFDQEEVEACQWFTYQETKNLELSFFYDKVIENLHKKELL